MTVFKSETEQFRSSLLRSELISHEEKQAAQQLTSRNAALNTQALHYQTALRHNELQTAQLRTSFDENRTTLLEYLAERFEEKLQWEENESNYRLSVEEQQHDDLVSDLMDQNAELQAEVQSLRLEYAEHRASPTQVGAPLGSGVGEIPLGDSDNLSPPQGGANHSAVAFQGPQGSNASWMPALPDPRVVPKELEGILGNPQVFSLSGGPKAKDSEAQEVQKLFEEPVEQKPIEVPKTESPHDSLVSALKAAIGKKDDDDKPRVKEAEVIRTTGKFLTLDTKILNALSVVAKGELNRQIINYKESEAAAGRAVRGRQVLFMFEQFFKTNEAAGSLYSVEDLLKVKLVRDDLSTFIHNWESVIAGLNHQPEETTLRDILLRELRNSSKLRCDLEVYDRAKEGEENHTYGYLIGQVC
ncbi:NLRC3 [Symbiodinium sp. KB8]|nr:NLRC3 [Symbiodinium sp. KB8]